MGVMGISRPLWLGVEENAYTRKTISHRCNFPFHGTMWRSMRLAGHPSRSRVRGGVFCTGIYLLLRLKEWHDASSYGRMTEYLWPRVWATCFDPSQTRIMSSKSLIKAVCDARMRASICCFSKNKRQNVCDAHRSHIYRKLLFSGIVSPEQ